MSGYSLSRLVTRACMALTLLAAIPVRADFIRQVTGTQGLADAATRIKNTIDSGTHVVRFSAYARVGQFRLDSPPAKVQTLIFERDSLQQSDSALRVSGDTALFEIKNMRAGTVILRGLAFHLASPESRLLAGAEPGKENLHLIIDSCFIFGDNLASSFLTWLGTTGSRVEIRRSFFVFRAGTPAQAKAILTGTSLTLANNLFHFGGQVSATLLAGGLLDFRSNTVHRTQIKAASEAFQGARYEVTRNFIGHRPGQDAFGETYPYFFWSNNFHPIDSFVRRNIILSGWSGFDHPGSSPRLFLPDTTNQTRDTLTVKPATELWDWYGPNGAMDSTGHAYGRDRRSEAYNVFPGAVSSQMPYEGNLGTVFFKPAPFPRQFSLLRTPASIPPGKDSIRFHSPGAGALGFGSFQLDSIVVNLATAYGDALLFSGDSLNQFHPQRIGSAYRVQPRVFRNDLPSARHYLLAFKGNTPRGVQVSPDRRSSSLGPDDSLAFGTVDSAGFTEVYVESLPGGYPDSLRELGRTLAVRTSAAVSGTMVFGSTLAAQPHWSDQVYWWRPVDSLFHPAVAAPDGRRMATAPATRNFFAYLVERLNVPKGRIVVFPLPGGGEVRAYGADGFQLAIDSSYVPDPLRFGRASRGISLRFSGRQPGDSLLLELPGGDDTEVIRVAGNSFPTVPAQADSLGSYNIPIAPGDSNVRLFSGIRFNVIANQEFAETLGEVRISGLLSSQSGKIGIHPFDQSLLARGIGTQDTLPSNAKLLGATGIRTYSLTLDRPWSATLAAARPGDSARMAAYAFDGFKWRPLPPPEFPSGAATLPTLVGLGGTDQAAAVFELLKPASEYVSTVTAEKDRTFSVTVLDNNDVHKLITGFSLHVLHVNELGTVESLKLGPAAVGQTLTQDLSNRSGLFMYAVVYRTVDGDYNLPAYQPITAFSWKPDQMTVGGRPEKAGGQWHLVGSPYGSTWERTFYKGDLADPQAWDTLDVFQVKSVGGQAAWERIPDGPTMPLKAGEAFLFNSARNIDHRIDFAAGFVPDKEHSVGPHTGWRFISPPYPMNFKTSDVGTNKREGPQFLELKVDLVAAPNGGRKREYSWGFTSQLKAFTGYACLFGEQEVLTFRPWANLAGTTLAKKTIPPSPLGRVQVTLEAEGRTRGMQLLAGEGIREVPFLPAPGAGLEMRVGGQGGWFLKRVEDLLEIDEPVVIRSPGSLRGRLALGLEGLPAGRADWRARFIHLASGKVLDPEAGFSLAAGEQEFRLVAGGEAFVSERIAAFRAGLPADLILSQNYPNPFRAQTRINVEWPALAGGTAVNGRRAHLEVFDARGRRVHFLPLGDVRAGRQVITLDGSRWEAGLYTYRLTVAGAGTKARLQKRMLVAP